MTPSKSVMVGPGPLYKSIEDKKKLVFIRSLYDLFKDFMRYRRFSYTQAEAASRAFREDDFGALASPAITPTGHFLDNDPQTPPPQKGPS